MNERERIEEALRESEERYRALMEQSVEAIYLYDAETKRVLESNAAFRELVGYSCLRYLKLMPVDFLKIDQSFVAGLGEERGDEAIVSGTIDLAHALGLKVIAEGVETADQLERLKQLNCDLAQGSYLSEPRPGEEVSVLLTPRR